MKVVTNECRASYVRIFKPQQNDQGKEEFSVTLLINKKDQKTLDNLEAAFSEVSKKRWGDRLPPTVQRPWHDGDGVRPTTGTPYGPECKGCYVLVAKSQYKPEIFGADMAELHFGEFDSGDYCRASLNAYSYDNKRKGVAFGLNGVKMTRKGEPLKGSTRSDFENNDDIPW